LDFGVGQSKNRYFSVETTEGDSISQVLNDCVEVLKVNKSQPSFFFFCFFSYS